MFVVYHSSEPKADFGYRNYARVKAVLCKECGSDAYKCSSCSHFVCPNKHVVLANQNIELNKVCTKCLHEDTIKDSNKIETKITKYHICSIM